MFKLIKEINSFSRPLILNNFFSVFISTILASIVGRISVNAIVSVEIVDNLNYSLIGLIGVGVIVFNIESSKVRLIDKNKFYDWFKSSYVVNSIIGVITILLVFLFSKSIFHNIYNLRGEALNVICIYAYVQSFYILSCLVLFSMTNLIKVKQMTGEILKAGMISSVIQIILAYIFVNYVFQENYRIVGVALGSVISQYLELLFLMYIVKDDIKKSISINSTRKKELIKKSIPFIFQEFLEGSIFQVFVIAMIARIGENTLSSYSVGMKIISLSLIPMYMYCNSLTVLIGEYESKKQVNIMKKLPFVTTMLTIIFYILVSSTCMIFKGELLNFLTDISLVKKSTSKILISLIFFSIFQVFFENSKYALQSIGESKKVLSVTLIFNTIFIIFTMITYIIGFLNLVILLLLLSINYAIISIIFYIKYIKKCNGIL